MPQPAGKNRWKKGQSGNPTGRPKAVPEVGAMCRALLPDGVKRLGRIMLKSKDHGQVIAAFKAIADRGLGKPVVQVEASGAVAVSFRWADATPAGNDAESKPGA